ncbi:MAG: UDP-N-acetylglucosamine 2-epimerase (non-hydrolyzing) [bacterium]
MVTTLFAFGTRPEAIKLAPLIKELSSRTDFRVKILITAQHREMLDQVLELFELKPDFDLDLMQPNQSLESLTARIVKSVGEVLRREKPDAVVLQGDTTTSFVTALAAFYQQIRVIHVEAGLRTGRKYAPFPEEINRRLTGVLTDLHFPPTKRAEEALLRENVPENYIFTVGNTVIDALLWVVEKARARNEELTRKFPMVPRDGRMLLVTGHRRESFGQGFLNICNALRSIAASNPDLTIVYPVHLNPNVQKPVRDILSGIPNVHLIEPQDYLSFVWLLDRCHLVLTDSGGVQEEAPTLGRPVLVMRDATERPEGIEAGVAELVGTDPERIVSRVQRLLDDRETYERMSKAQNPYGDGTSSRQIADILVSRLVSH